MHLHEDKELFREVVISTAAYDETITAIQEVIDGGMFIE
jgi:hypothetical protein